jgi:hypothetical protein
MKKLLLSACIILISLSLYAQEEGTAVAQARFARSKSIYISGGPSLTFGKNIGDYSKGLNFEGGFMKRLNKVLSIGPSISYIKFNYDPEVTNTDRGAYVGEGDVFLTYQSSFGTTLNEKYGLNENYTYGYVLNLEGGDITLASLSFNIKLNFIPVSDDSKISIYGFAKPFITSSKRAAVNGSGTRYLYETYEDLGGTVDELDDLIYYNQGDGEWYADGYVEEWGPDSFPALKEESSITGGIFIGPGVEIMPAKAVSIFAQAAFGYTFPVSIVSTESYGSTVDDDYLAEEFPIVKKGFPSLNIQFGFSFNF